MELSSLQIFVEIVRRGSFAAVARDRDIEPSAVSRTVSALEEELGVRLLQRTTRRLSLTEAGRVYFERIEPLVEEVERARLIVSDVGTRPRGTLRVTTSVSFGQKCVVPLLPGLADAFPDLSVELLLTDAVVDIVGERIDLAVRLGRLTDSALIATQLLRARYVVCASPDYLKKHDPPRAPRDLAAHDCLLFPLAGFRSRWIFRDGAQQVIEVPIKGRFVLSSGIALHECALAGMGPALLPLWLTEGDLRRGTLVNLLPDYDVTATDFDSAVWLLFPSRVYVPHKVRAFADYLKQEFRERPPWLR